MKKLPPIVEPGSVMTHDRALEAATGVIRQYCGWHVTPSITETLVLDGNGGEVVQLPSNHVTGVDEVSVGGSAVRVDWSETGVLRLSGGGRFPKKYRSVEVTFTHGHDYAADVAGVVQAVASRLMMNPTGNVVQQRAGTQAVSFAQSSGGSTGGGTLLQSEKDLLAPYRLVWGP